MWLTWEDYAISTQNFVSTIEIDKSELKLLKKAVKIGLNKTLKKTTIFLFQYSFLDQNFCLLMAKTCVENAIKSDVIFAQGIRTEGNGLFQYTLRLLDKSREEKKYINHNNFKNLDLFYDQNNHNPSYTIKDRKDLDEFEDIFYKGSFYHSRDVVHLASKYDYLLGFR